MDWQKCMDQAIGYIEDNLSGKIEYEVAAQKMRCSVWEFQRLFSFIAQIPLSEYIRRRRLSLAAHDLQVNKDKVIDVALRYGYDSPASFSRAFSQIHGITPKAARCCGATLKAFPRLAFQFTLKGVEAMEYTVVNKKEFQVIGRTRRMTVHNNAHYEAIGTFWHEWEQDGMFERYSEKYCQGSPHCIDVSTPSPEPDAFDYTIGFMWNGKKDIDGLDCITVPGGLYAVFPVPDGCEDMGDFMSHIITEFLPSLGYELAGVDAEYFSDSKNEVWFLLKK